ncbi:hypothetical protein [Klebsiella quasipneumoniae]|uniref:hypothetical protein n=1 Tax=Klebsiella quasipneumoniae TaxID=1463165 RepID=UPI001D18C7E9|nr:hypothetical protein [Klebsiella quasipneumoniae]
MVALLRRSSAAEDRPALFAAQFALSHSCWLVTYPLAGWVGYSMGNTGLHSLPLTIVAALSLILPIRIRGLSMSLRPGAQPHTILKQTTRSTHEHDFVIDDEHPSPWPKKEK